MTEKSEIETVIRAAYAARLAEDLPAMLAHFAEDARYAFNAQGATPSENRPVRGKPALEAMFRALIDAYQIADWKEVALLVDGDRAALHWRAKVTVVKTGVAATYDVFDFLKFEGGKIIELEQSTDTAKLMTAAGL